MKLRLKILIIATAILLFLAGLYLLLTSSFFGVHVLLPVICRTSGLQLTAQQVSWSPIRGTFELRDLCLGPVGEPFLLAERAVGEIRLRRLLQRQINAPLIELDGAELSFCRDIHNRWNFTRLIEKNTAAREPEIKREPGKTKPFQLELERISITRSRITATDHTPDRGGRLEISNFECEANRYGNGLQSHIIAAGQIQLVSGRDLSLSGKLALRVQLDSGDDLSLHRLEADTVLSQVAGKIADRTLSAGTVEGDMELSYAGRNGWELREFSLRQKLSDTIRSRIEADGIIRNNPFQCDLNISARISDELTAALSDCFRGINPGRIRLVGEGHITAGTNRLSTSGTLNIIRDEGEAQFGRERLMLPGFELKLKHHVSADLQKHSFEIGELKADVLENQRALASITLNEAFAYNAEESRIESRNASLSIHLNALPVPLLRLAFADPAFTPTAGVLNGGFTLALTPDGLPEVTGTVDLTDGAFRSGSWSLDQLSLQADAHCLLNRDGTFAFDRFQLQAARAGTALGKISGTAALTPASDSGSAKLALEGAVDAWLPLLPPEWQPTLQQVPGTLFPATLSGSMQFRYGPDFQVYENLRLRLDAAAGMVVEAELPKQQFSDQAARNHWDFTIRTSAPADALHRLYPGSNILTRGQLLTDTRIHAAYDFQTVGIESNIDLKSGGMPFPERADANLDLHSSLALYLTHGGRLQLNNFDATLRVDGNPALRLGGSGHYLFGDDRLNGNLQIRYLNDAFLDTILPGRLTDGLVTGELQAEIAPRTGNFLLNGNLAMDKFRTPAATRPFYGKAHFRLEGDPRQTTLTDCSLLLADSVKQLADIRATATIPRHPEQPASLRVASQSVDLWTMYENVAAPETPPPAASDNLAFFPPPPHQPERIPFHFGNRPLLLDLDLQQLRWKTGTFALTGQALLHRHHAETRSPAHLFINGADLAFELSLDDRPEGMALQTRAQAADPIAIAPLLDLFERSPDCTGTISDFTWDLSFDRLLSSEWHRDFQGTASATVNDLQLTYTKANSPLSRIILLPIELLVRAGTLVPDTLKVQSNWEKLLQSSSNITDSPLSTITFHHGTLKLQAEQDLLQIKDFSLQGEPVHHLDFTGTAMLAQPHDIDLNASIVIGNLATKLPIGGTLSAPKPDLTTMFRAISGASLDVLLKRLGGGRQPDTDTGSGPAPIIRLLRDLTGFE